MVYNIIKPYKIWNLNNIYFAKIIEFIQIHATFAKIYTLDKLWKTLLKSVMPTETYGITTKLN